MLLQSGPITPCIRPFHEIILLIINPQNDYHSNNPMAVPGAIEDSFRVSEMIYRERLRIDRIVVILNSHNVNHIAHASFWESSKPVKELDNPNTIRSEEKVLGPKHNGKAVLFQPKPFSRIRAEDVKKGWWRPSDPSLTEYCIEYCTKLERLAIPKTLTIWPEHCLIGSAGHCVVDNIQEQLEQWSIEQGKIVDYVHIGQNNLTEMYSAIRAAVPVEGDSQTHKNMELLGFLRSAKKLIVCGQALSECVARTMEDIVEDWTQYRRSLGDIFLLNDASSPARDLLPTRDHEVFAREFVHHLSSRGVQISTCSTVFSEIYT